MIGATGLTVERVSDPARLPALTAAWDALVDEREPGAVFRSAAWLLPWWEHFSAGKQLCVYTARRGPKLVGVLPAYRVDTPLGGRRLRLMGDGVVSSDYLGVIARPDGRSAASVAIAEALPRAERDLWLDGLTDDDPLVGALERGARAAGAGFARLDLDPCPFLPLAEAGDFADWLRRRPDGAGKQLDRRRRWLRKQPGFRLEVHTDGAAIAAALPTLWGLHRARWAEVGGSAAIDDPRVEQFHQASARQLARRGWARLYLLQVDGAPRAALYGFERGGRFAYYQSGSDPAWSQRSVGRVVLGAAIEDAFARGLAEFDFLRGDEAYKRLFAASRRQLVQVRVVAGGPARALRLSEEARMAGLRLARERLSATQIEWLRQQRRLVRRWTTGR